MKLPKIEGFSVNAAEVLWITCDWCEEAELVYGENADQQAVVWAEQHYRSCPAGDRTTSNSRRCTKSTT